MSKFAVARMVLHYYETVADLLLEVVKYDVEVVDAPTSGNAIDQVYYPLRREYPECGGYLCRVKATEIADAAQEAAVIASV